MYLDYLTDVYGNLAMVNYPYSSSFLAPLPAYPVREFCFRFSANYPNETQLIDVRIYAHISHHIPILFVNYN